MTSGTILSQILTFSNQKTRFMISIERSIVDAATFMLMPIICHFTCLESNEKKKKKTKTNSYCLNKTNVSELGSHIRFPDSIVSRFAKRSDVEF